MFNPSRDQVRLFFCQTWKAYRAGQPLEGAQTLALDALLAHPEYHVLLETPEEALEREWTPEGGRENPFLHLSLHLALEEQLSVDQPAGIRTAYEALLRRCEPHEAKHRVLECLAEMIWEIQRHQRPFDSEDYLERIRRAAGKD